MSSTDKQMDRRTDGRTDKVNPVYPPPSNFVGRGYKNMGSVDPWTVSQGCIIVAEIDWQFPSSRRQQSFVSISDKKSYRKISWSLETIAI